MQEDRINVTNNLENEDKNTNKENHIKSTFKCRNCDFTSGKMIQLEEHIIKTHKEEIIKYKCDFCSEGFVMKWRMLKHKEGHKSPIKKCHYFNNGKQCPYESIGCMFEHEESVTCKYNTDCKHKLCQFKHDDCEVNKVNNENDNSPNREIIIANNLSLSIDDNNTDSEMDDEEIEIEDEAIDLFCEQYCSKESYFHIHCKDHVDEYYGLNLKTSYENVDRQKMTVTQFLPCISSWNH